VSENGRDTQDANRASQTNKWIEVLVFFHLTSVVSCSELLAMLPA